MSIDTRFKNKVIWITGASSGIGKALALEFANLGANLILSSRNEESLNEVKVQCAKKLQKEHLVLPYDATNENQVLDLVVKAKFFKGKIDYLINNAGISQRSGILETEMSTYRKLFEIDVLAPIALTKAVLPIMIAQKSGHIVVTSSVAGKLGVPFRTGYCAAKHAVMGFFDALRTEVFQYNIKVSTIIPGYIRTNISKNAVKGDGTSFGKVDASIEGGMDVDECAKVIIKGLEKGKSEIPVGVGLEMKILTLKRFFPKLVFKIMNGQYKKIAKSNQLDI
ncbi:MAG: short chain dehydrogenase [Gammaproteobacteria bacterium]|nr:MAG: short chain dehydrogenase [Gammaproteobacteria bacterium]